VASAASTCSVVCATQATYAGPTGCPLAGCGQGSVNCCYRSDGTSPYDADGDGFMACNSGCGATVDACAPNGTAPCDCDDTNPAIYPGNGC
jgi:hypothetical protein